MLTDKTNESIFDREGSGEGPGEGSGEGSGEDSVKKDNKEVIETVEV